MSSLSNHPLHHSAATVKTLIYSDGPRSEKYSKWYKKGSKGRFGLKCFLFFSEWEAYFFHGIGWCGSKETEVYNLGSPLSDQENDLSDFFLSCPPSYYFRAIFVISLYLQRLDKSWVSGEALCTPFPSHQCMHAVYNQNCIYQIEYLFLELHTCEPKYTESNETLRRKLFLADIFYHMMLLSLIP